MKNRTWSRTFAVALAVLVAPRLCSAAPTIELSPSEETQCVVVRGVAEQVRGFLSRARVTPEFWRELLSVRVATSAPSDPPVLGAHRVEGADLVFEPRFPLRPGLAYTVVYSPALLGRGAATADRVTRRVSLPRPRAQPARVAAVYPTGDTLPENQLKFYIHFSAPMSRGESYRHVRLVRADGEEVDRPFLELGEELWNASGTRFTLFFDPGRIKRGLKPREDVGPALVEGGAYSLVIDATWRDATGARLAERYVKPFHVAPPDADSPRAEDWQITPPAAGGRAALIVRFDEPLDHALARRVIGVHNESGERMAGTVRVSDGETQWSFTPDSPWRAGRYHLVAAPELEDRAGNSLARPFETPMDDPQEAKRADEPRRLPFEVLSTVAP